MLRRTIFAGSLGLLTLGPLLAAQERTPARARVWINGDEVRPFDLLARRRARIGVTLDMRAVENDSIGATVEAVTPGGPAAKAGIRSGDIITKLNGASLVRAEKDREGNDEESLAGVRLAQLVAKLNPGDTVTVEYRRGKDVKTATVMTSKELAMADGSFSYNFGDDDRPAIARLPRTPEAPMAWGFAFGGRFADLELAPINQDLGTYFGTTEGVLVINAPEKNSLGLKGGDVILSIDGRKARGPGSVLRILRSYEEGDIVKLEIMRNKSHQSISSKVSKDEDE